MSGSFKSVGLLLGAACAGGAYFFCHAYLHLDRPPAIVAGVTALCAVWWCTEALPIPVTALVPFAVFPFAGVMDHEALASAYGDKFILLFMAGFMISRAAEKSGVHLRVAHGILRLIGTDSNRRVILGFLAASAFCSMWISNTATALIMLPVAMAVVRRADVDQRFAVALLLAIAYGSSIGGMATLIGTPPNGVFTAVYETTTHKTVDFVTWMKVGVPVSGLMLVAAGLLLTARVRGGGAGVQAAEGSWTSAQRRVFAVLAVTALLWVTRVLPFGWGGWSHWLHMPMAHDATVGLLAVIVLFLLPAGVRDRQGRRERLLDWPTARDIPWGILILFGGGIAIAKAFEATGLARHIGGSLEVLTSLHPLLLIGIICFTVTFMTEVTSNTATTTLLMPILAASGLHAGVDPALLMVPAAISASAAFMLPVATPPNAIVFGGSELITIPRMVRAGVLLNLVGVVIVTLVCYLVIDPVNGFGGASRSDVTPAVTPGG